MANHESESQYVQQRLDLPNQIIPRKIPTLEQSRAALLGVTEDVTKDSLQYHSDPLDAEQWDREMFGYTEDPEEVSKIPVGSGQGNVLFIDNSMLPTPEQIDKALSGWDPQILDNQRARNLRLKRHKSQTPGGRVFNI